MGGACSWAISRAELISLAVAAAPIAPWERGETLPRTERERDVMSCS